MKDAQSITDPPLKAFVHSEVEAVEEDTLFEEPFGGHPCRHEVWAFQPATTRSSPSLVVLGAARMARGGSGGSGEPAGLPDRRRGEGKGMRCWRLKQPVHPHRPFFATHFITLGEAVWLNGKEIFKGRAPSLSAGGVDHPPERTPC